jgi:hypothetical protein
MDLVLSGAQAALEAAMLMGALAAGAGAGAAQPAEKVKVVAVFPVTVPVAVPTVMVAPTYALGTIAREVSVAVVAV